MWSKTILPYTFFFKLPTVGNQLILKRLVEVLKYFLTILKLFYDNNEIDADQINFEMNFNFISEFFAPIIDLKSIPKSFVRILLYFS